MKERIAKERKGEENFKQISTAVAVLEKNSHHYIFL